MAVFANLVVGLCPGPALVALVALATGGRPPLLYVAAMLAGMTTARWLDPIASPPAARQAAA